MHHAPVSLHRVVNDEPVQQTAVVPHDEIAHAPAVPINELRLCRMLEEATEQGRALHLLHAKDAGRMIAEIERLAAGLGVRPHQRVIDRRPY